MLKSYPISQPCYYATDKKTGKKVLIPMCWAVVVSMEKERCSCPRISEIQIDYLMSRPY